MNRRRKLRIALACLGLSAVMLFNAARLWLGGQGVTLGAGLAQDWLAVLKPHGLLLFALFQIGIAASGVLPASLIGVSAGGLYGVWAGFGLAAVTTMAGAAIALGLSRSLARPAVERMLHRRAMLRRLDTAFALQGWRVVCLLRISPIMPFAATSYMLGLSSVSKRDYLLGTLAALPALFGYVCLGSLVPAGLGSDGPEARRIRWCMLVAGACATILLTIQLARILKRSVQPDTKLP